LYHSENSEPTQGEEEKKIELNTKANCLLSALAAVKLLLGMSITLWANPSNYA
jgi:hypothetical protein